jgi:glycerophosphoryl diester phosphodiesterase
VADALEKRINDTFKAVGSDVKALQPPKGLVDLQDYPVILAHRGGAGLFPEQSAEGFAFHVQQGFAIEWDVAQLSDGTRILCHDETTGRSFIDIPDAGTGTLTPAQWRKAKTINPVMPSAQASRAPFLGEMLDLYGKKALIVFDTKDDYTLPTFMPNTIADIKARRLERDLYAQSFNYDVSKGYAAAGIAAAWCSTKDPRTDTTPRSFAQIRADGIEVLHMNMSNITASLVTAAHAAGLKMAAYTILTPAQQELMISYGVDIITSNDPLGTSRQAPTVRVQPSVAKGPWPGWRGTTQTGGTGSSATVSPLDVPAQPGRNGGVAFNEGDPTLMQRNVYCPWAGKISGPCRIDMDIEFAKESGTNSPEGTSMGFILAENKTDPDRDIQDGAVATQNGFVVILSRRVQSRTYEYVNGAASTLLGKFPTTDPSTYPMAALSFKANLSATFTSTTLQVTYNYVNASGVWVPGVASAYTFTKAPSNYSLLLRWSSTCGEIYNTTITNL